MEWQSEETVESSAGRFPDPQIWVGCPNSSVWRDGRREEREKDPLKVLNK
jgi:hypothetical protein